VPERSGSLRRLDGIFHRFPAASIYPVRQDEERLMSLLRFHQLVRRETDRIVKQRPSAAEVGRLHELERGTELRARRGKTLQDYDLLAKSNYERFVFISRSM
jgi:hypothetical protein